MNQRTMLFALIVFSLAKFGICNVSASAQQFPSSKNVQVYEYTFIKSHDAKPEKAIEYIVKNWFAMDKLAAEKGLLVEYNVFEANADAKAEWNIVVAVGYPTERGYEAIAEEFTAIRQQHKKILVDGKDFKDLATIVGSRKMFPKFQSGSETKKDKN